ncbi:DegT/DnrJ/EryC1/StrS family aminotransferase [Egicoccus sp. AB-alg2]|uniref:DegT/DnrJ/EryC1/StrS family aminotransferase n=1 Tax=Egicoccus sp. AB-alg2 TaxID=3242693 RepID=UPI00359CBCCD
MTFRTYLSPPDVGEAERERLLAAFDSGWIAPVGPDLDAFEAELAERVERRHAVALSSGTAALHLGLLALGVGTGDEVLVPTLTFAATANAVVYTGATPVFVDADPSTWNIDLKLVEDELARRRRNGVPQVKAIVPVDLYGRCVDYTRLVPLAADFGVPVLADAAEALGASHAGRPAGAFGRAAVFSFNGNKIITTSGGGMLVTDDEEVARRVRHLATQAREPVTHYEHRDVGFNYRLSNLLAALGRAQLAGLDAKLARRREINQTYRQYLGSLPGVAFAPCDPNGEPNNWLTCLTVQPRGARHRDAVIEALVVSGIEARPLWKPMHLQPAYKGAASIGGSFAERLSDTGLCLPSGSSMTDLQLAEVIEVVRWALL